MQVVIELAVYGSEFEGFAHVKVVMDTCNF
jgi:hypothetical protein